jgi:cytochrome c-type biogenesis protein
VSGIIVAAATAFWLGILTSVSPCPLASNVAAISYVGRSVGSARRVLFAGMVYSLGRAFTYVLVGMLVVTSVLSIPGVSFFLQHRMNQALGPLLILIGAGMLGWGRLRWPAWSMGESFTRRIGAGGIPGAGLLGILFALSFCPVSAGLFFGALVPLAVQADSQVLLPALYGLGTGLPVAGFALVLSLGARWAGRTFRALTGIERSARPITAVVFLLAGLYLSLQHIFGLNL